MAADSGLLISEKAAFQLQYAADGMPKDEISGFGKVIDHGDGYVELVEIVIPPQEVGGAHVEIDEDMQMAFYDLVLRNGCHGDECDRTHQPLAGEQEDADELTCIVKVCAGHEKRGRTITDAKHNELCMAGNIKDWRVWWHKHPGNQKPTPSNTDTTTLRELAGPNGFKFGWMIGVIISQDGSNIYGWLENGLGPWSLHQPDIDITYLRRESPTIKKSIDAQLKGVKRKTYTSTSTSTGYHPSTEVIKWVDYKGRKVKTYSNYRSDRTWFHELGAYLDKSDELVSNRYGRRNDGSWGPMGGDTHPQLPPARSLTNGKLLGTGTGAGSSGHSNPGPVDFEAVQSMEVSEVRGCVNITTLGGAIIVALDEDGKILAAWMKYLDLLTSNGSSSQAMPWRQLKRKMRGQIQKLRAGINKAHGKGKKAGVDKPRLEDIVCGFDADGTLVPAGNEQYVAYDLNFQRVKAETQLPFDPSDAGEDPDADADTPPVPPSTGALLVDEQGAYWLEPSEEEFASGKLMGDEFVGYDIEGFALSKDEEDVVVYGTDGHLITGLDEVTVDTPEYVKWLRTQFNVPPGVADDDVADWCHEMFASGDGVEVYGL